MSMIIIYRFHDGPEPVISRGVMECLVNHIKAYGPITSLDAWAHDWEITSHYVNRCAHLAAHRGLLKLTRQEGAPGRPYKVELSSSQEETHEN